MTINEITEKIIESKNNDIAKAFTMHIGSLLLTNGIVPVMTEYTGNDVKNITDTDEYKLVMEYGITFKELDCSKHDKEIYSKAIDDFVEKLNAKCDGMIKEKWNSNVAPISWAEAYADFKDDIDEIARQLKAGVTND